MSGESAGAHLSEGEQMQAVGSEALWTALTLGPMETG